MRTDLLTIRPLSQKGRWKPPAGKTLKELHFSQVVQSSVHTNLLGGDVIGQGHALQSKGFPIVAFP